MFVTTDLAAHTISTSPHPAKLGVLGWSLRPVCPNELNMPCVTVAAQAQGIRGTQNSGSALRFTLVLAHAKIYNARISKFAAKSNVRLLSCCSITPHPLCLRTSISSAFKSNMADGSTMKSESESAQPANPTKSAKTANT